MMGFNNQTLNKMFAKVGALAGMMTIGQLVKRINTVLLLLSCHALSYADGVIPQIDPARENKSWIENLQYYFVTYGAPILLYGGAIFLIVSTGWKMYQGYTAYTKTSDFGDFKSALVGGAIMIGIAVLMFSFGGQVLDKWKANVS